MDYTMGIAALVLTVVLWLLYHKIVTVIYHGNMGSHIIKELFGCFIVSVLLVSTVSVVAGKILSAAGGVLLFLLKAVLIVAGIAVVVFLIATIAKAISSKKSDGNDSCDCSSQSTAKPVSEKNRSGEQPYEVVPSEADNMEISKYIKENFTSSDYVQAIKYYREKTGADFETAKATVDSILKSEKASGES